MILVIGGLASGKRTHAVSLGYPEDDMAFDVHERVRDGEDADALLEALSTKAVVTCAEVGNGIVPLDPDDRAWRERVGRLSCSLAERADCVVRMVCGIPVVLKGDVARGSDAKHIDFVLIRHGQTPGNEERRYVGAVDQPLSDGGRVQARAAGVHPEVQRVYVSTLQRTHETAAIMFPNAQQIVVADVQEMDFGAFAGRTSDEMADDPDYRAWVDGACQGTCPGGESRGEFTDRVCAAIERLINDASARGESQLVMVAHGGTMMAFLDRYAHDPSKQYWEWLLGNCEGYRLSLTCDDSGVAIQSIARWE